MSAFAVSASSVRAVSTAIGLSSRIRVRAKLVAPVAKARTSSRAICVTTFARRASSSGGPDEEDDAEFERREFEETFLKTQMSNIDFLLGELEDDIKTISPEEKQAINEADDFDDLPEELKNHVVAVNLKDLSETLEAVGEKLLENKEDPSKYMFDSDLAYDAQNLIVKAGERFEALME